MLKLNSRALFGGIHVHCVSSKPAAGARRCKGLSIRTGSTIGRGYQADFEVG
jgi:hypothetical protein